MNFEEVINAFREEGNFSIFITGSNSYLLSGELATKLTGRYIEIEMFPLNFYEFIEMKKFRGLPVSESNMEEFNEYIRFGGLPKTLEFEGKDHKDFYVKNVISQIIDKDIVKHRKIRNKTVFDKVMTYIINNFDKYPKKIKNILDQINEDLFITDSRLEPINDFFDGFDVEAVTSDWEDGVMVEVNQTIIQLNNKLKEG